MKIWEVGIHISLQSPGQVSFIYAYTLVRMRESITFVLFLHLFPMSMFLQVFGMLLNLSDRTVV